ncbi:hypothetical protein Tco_0994412 [Tanacetum coccineum]
MVSRRILRLSNRFADAALWLSKRGYNVARRNPLDEITAYQLWLGFNKIPMLCDNIKMLLTYAETTFNIQIQAIDIRFHFIKEHVENGVIELYFVNMEYQLADIFTKDHAEKN